MKDLNIIELGQQHKEKEQNKRTEEITKIADSYLKGLFEEEILIGELERIGQYIQATIQKRIAEHKENTYIQRLGGETIKK